MAPKALIGPTLADLDAIGGGKVTLATAFYSAGALNALDLAVDELRLMVRLDTSSVYEWAVGSIDPEALRDFIERHSKTCGSVSLHVSPRAHAKLYKGHDGYYVGSANLSSRGFSGSRDEILWFENDAPRRKLVESALNAYEGGFQQLSFEDLDDYVNSNRAAARALAKTLPAAARADEDRTPADVPRPSRLGDYAHFRKWLDRQSGAAAAEIAARANGKGNLSGHIRQNFLGLRQFFISEPSEARRLAKEDSATYSLARDRLASLALGSFAQHRASDEGPFSVSIWRTYLPESAGGKPKTGGGTSGNLNRMLPLVARYLISRIEGTK
jgi:hypothetical protein